MRHVQGGINLIPDPSFAKLTTQQHVIVDNNADGNCFYEAVLDAAYFTPGLDRLVPWNTLPVAEKRHTSAQARFRSLLGDYARAHHFYRDKAELIALIENVGEWATTDVIHVVADALNICVILYSGVDKSWTMTVPRATDSCDPTRAIRICNLGARVTKNHFKKTAGHTQGLHFVALCVSPVLRVFKPPEKSLVREWVRHFLRRPKSADATMRDVFAEVLKHAGFKATMGEKNREFIRETVSRVL